MSSENGHALADELAAFEREKPRLLERHFGQFSLFKGSEFIGAYSTYESAYSAGLRRFGVQPFLIRQIVEEEPNQTAPALVLGLIRARP